MNILIYVVILAVVQGVAEFLPVSSSGHLAVLGALFGFREDRSLALGIVLHAGSLLAILVFYFRTLLGFFRREQFHLLLMVIAGTIPAGLAGVALKLSGLDEKLFGDPVVIGLAFLITATLLRLSEKPKLIVRPEAERDLPPTGLEAITLRQALVVGVSQMFAILPGLSRSGSTIATGLILGNKKETLAQFSFLMVIPPILGEALLSGMEIMKRASEANAEISASALIVGFLAAFLSGCAACKWMINIVKKGKLVWFGVYCAIAGAVTIIYSLVG